MACSVSRTVMLVLWLGLAGWPTSGLDAAAPAEPSSGDALGGHTVPAELVVGQLVVGQSRAWSDRYSGAEEDGPSRPPRQQPVTRRHGQALSPRARPGGVAGLFANLLSSLTHPTASSDCPGGCYHALAALMCREVLEDRSCSRPSMRCCADARPVRKQSMPVVPSADSKEPSSATATRAPTTAAVQTSLWTTMAETTAAKTTTTAATSTTTTTPATAVESATKNKEDFIDSSPENDGVILEPHKAERKKLACPGVCVARRIAHYCEAVLDVSLMCADDQRCCVPRTLFDTAAEAPPQFVLLGQTVAGGQQDQQQLAPTSESQPHNVPGAQPVLQLPPKPQPPPDPRPHVGTKRQRLPETTPNTELHLQPAAGDPPQDRKRLWPSVPQPPRAVAQEQSQASRHPESPLPQTQLKPMAHTQQQKDVHIRPGRPGVVLPQRPQCQGQCVRGLFAYLCDWVDRSVRCSNGGRCCLTRPRPSRRPITIVKTTTEPASLTEDPSSLAGDSGSFLENSRFPAEDSRMPDQPSKFEAESTETTTQTSSEQSVEVPNEESSDENMEPLPEQISGSSVEQVHGHDLTQIPGPAIAEEAPDQVYEQYHGKYPEQHPQQYPGQHHGEHFDQNPGPYPDQSPEQYPVQFAGEPSTQSAGSPTQQVTEEHPEEVPELAPGQFSGSPTAPEVSTEEAYASAAYQQLSESAHRPAGPGDSQPVCPGTCLPAHMVSTCRLPARPLPDSPGCPDEHTCCGGLSGLLGKEPPSSGGSTATGSVLDALLQQALSGGGGAGGGGGLLGSLAPLAASLLGGGGGGGGGGAALMQAMLPALLGGVARPPTRRPPARPDRYEVEHAAGRPPRPQVAPPPTTPAPPVDSRPLCPDTCISPLLSFTCFGGAEVTNVFRCSGKSEQRCCAKKSSVRRYWERHRRPAVVGYQRYPAQPGPPDHQQYQAQPGLSDHQQYTAQPGLSDRQRYPSSTAGAGSQPAYPHYTDAPLQYQRRPESPVGYPGTPAGYLSGYPDSMSMQPTEYPAPRPPSADRYRPPNPTSGGDPYQPQRPTSNGDAYQPQRPTSGGSLYGQPGTGSLNSKPYWYSGSSADRDIHSGDRFGDAAYLGQKVPGAVDSYQQPDQTFDDRYRQPAATSDGATSYGPSLPPSANVKYRQPALASQPAAAAAAAPTSDHTAQSAPSPPAPRNKYVCGVKGAEPPRQARVVGGRDAAPGEWCWHVALVNSLNQYLCGGALIGTQWVLTAAHCITGIVRSGDAIYVRVGDHDLTSKEGSPGAQTLRVSTTYIHHNHNTQTLDNDIALLKLHGEVDLAEGVCLVCLPVRDVAQQAGRRCTVSGYGYIGEDGTIPLKVRSAELPIVADDDCVSKINSVTEKVFILPSSSFCAGGDLGHDACQGDGGGPLVCSVDGYYELSGIVSWGFGCGREDVPGVYVKIASFIGWINQIISVNNLR